MPPRTLRVTKAGFDGAVPGPELRVKRGEAFAVRVVNELAAPIAVHWHGVRLVNAMDGAPPLTQAPIAPGASFDYRFVPPDAGTFFYRALSPTTPLPNGADLCGAFIVEETAFIDVDHDVTLMARTDLEIRARMNERLRLRFINAAAEIQHVRLAGLPVFVMATDGQPAQPFAARDGRLTLGAGNRIDVFADCVLAPGQSTPITIEPSDRAAIPIGRVICEAADAPGRPALRSAPKPLPANPLPERMDFRDAFRCDAVAGQAAKKDAPLFTIKRGRTVMLGVSNPTAANIYMHLHGHSFRLLDALDDGWKPFWLDTMPLAPGGKARIAFVADNPGKWLIEGLAESSSGVWFEVT